MNAQDDELAVYSAERFHRLWQMLAHRELQERVSDDLGRARKRMRRRAFWIGLVAILQIAFYFAMRHMGAF